MNDIPEEVLEKCKKDTLDHIERVRYYVNLFVNDLKHRAEIHDASKLQSPELEGFASSTLELSKCTFPSPEYTASLENLKPTLHHHYKYNRHHPEHWPEGVDSMNLMDLVEMLADWKAATERYKDGDIIKSLEYNAERFNFSPQLKQIFKNTIKDFYC